jgi:hypothetical protein
MLLNGEVPKEESLPEGRLPKCGIPSSALDEGLAQLVVVVEVVQVLLQGGHFQPISVATLHDVAILVVYLERVFSG